MNHFEALALLIADLYQQVRTLQQENEQLKAAQAPEATVNAPSDPLAGPEQHHPAADQNWTDA